VWLIYLEGGLWCYDEPSCRVRSQQTPFFVSSAHWPVVQSLGGIFDDDPRRNPLARAHKVYVGYCSSDAWSGNIGAADVSFGFNFRGQRNIAATIATLQAQAGLGASGNTRVLFGGCSAGARGAMFNLVRSLCFWRFFETLLTRFSAGRAPRTTWRPTCRRRRSC